MCTHNCKKNFSILARKAFRQAQWLLPILTMQTETIQTQGNKKYCDIDVCMFLEIVATQKLRESCNQALETGFLIGHTQSLEVVGCDRHPSSPKTERNSGN
jgi:hypothetical protein